MFILSNKLSGAPEIFRRRGSSDFGWLGGAPLFF